MKKNFQTCVDIIEYLVGNEYVYFDTAFGACLPGEKYLDVWACCSKDGKIYLMDADQQWYELEPSDLNFQIVVDKLEQKLGKIINKKNKALAS